jgi:hypothetical protein
MAKNCSFTLSTKPTSCSKVLEWRSDTFRAHPVSSLGRLAELAKLFRELYGIEAASPLPRCIANLIFTFQTQVGMLISDDELG